jgi:tRNA A37 threonylcarbamoyladenosine biosynthesis protein TsaE
MSSSWNECMSIEIVKHQVKLFVSSSTPEVMGIKGAWGVGKTYSWKKYLSEYKLDKAIALPRYAYVSLFGINSLEAFKYAIFENTVKRDLIGTEASIETFKENTTGIADSLTRKSYNIFKNAPLIKNFSSTIE